MESLTLTLRKPSNDELARGLGLSLLIHVLVLTLALCSSWILPHKEPKLDAYTVNLVNLQDLGPPPLVRKGSETGQADAAPKAPAAAKSPASADRSKAGPLVPVKRLQMDEPVRKVDNEIKKIDAHEAPRAPEPAQSTASIEKNLDKLIPKPKAQPKPEPITQEPARKDPSPAATGRAAAAASSNAKASANAADDGEESPKPGTGGTPKGREDGSTKGVASEGSPTGSAESGRVIANLLGIYGQKVKDQISRFWEVPPELLKTGGLVTYVRVVSSRDGRILEIRVEKGSGNSLFDEIAKRAVQKAAPLPPVPEVFARPQVEMRITFRPEGLS